MTHVNAGLAAERVYALMRDLRFQNELWADHETDAGNLIGERNPDVAEFNRRKAAMGMRESERTILVGLIAELIAEQMARPA